MTQQFYSKVYMYLKGMKTGTQISTCTQMFMVETAQMSINK